MSSLDTPAPDFPEHGGAITLMGPAGALEALIELPENAGEACGRDAIAVICHPLPTEGGSMHNKVVTMTARSLRELGATTFRFNFRGTGQSQGAFDHGNGEEDDLRAVVAWVRAHRPQSPLWLAGFSFGAYVSLRAAVPLQADLLISIAPPAGRWAFDRIAKPTMPWLLIQGEADEIVDPQAVYAWLARIDAHVEVVRLPDTSHFFHRKLMDLRDAIHRGVQTCLPGTR